jgi:hypothetical protein
MATMKANGGAIRLWRHRATGTRYALCANGKLLVNRGGNDGWKHSQLSLERIERDCVEDDSAGARATRSRTAADAHAHEQAKRLRRVRDALE